MVRRTTGRRVQTCVEINQCVGCTRKFFTKSFLGDDAAVLARSSGEEPASPRHRAGVASTSTRTCRKILISTQRLTSVLGRDQRVVATRRRHGLHPPEARVGARLRHARRAKVRVHVQVRLRAADEYERRRRPQLAEALRLEVLRRGEASRRWRAGGQIRLRRTAPRPSVMPAASLWGCSSPHRRAVAFVQIRWREDIRAAVLLQQQRFVGRTCSQRAQKTRCNLCNLWAAGEGTHTRESPRH